MVEEDRILRYHTDGFTERGLSNITNILAVDQNATLAFFEVIEPVE